MNFASIFIVVLLIFLGISPDSVLAAAPDSAAGQQVFEAHCSSCHGGSAKSVAPGHAAISGMSARAILASLEDGKMRAQGEALSITQRRAVAEWWAGAPVQALKLADSAYCTAPADQEQVSPERMTSGWGGDPHATGFRDGRQAGLSVADVPNLELKWAFGFPGAIQSRSRPAVVGDLLIVGSATGEVYGLDRRSGCVHWMFNADAAVRGAIALGQAPAGRLAAYFADFRANVYAVDVRDGALLWRNAVPVHQDSTVTGSVAFHDGRLFVPLSSMEVLTARNPEYECCTSSGAIVALDAVSGEELWRHRVIEQEPAPAGENARGTALYGPSGAPVWSSPTVDARRGLLYFGSGENYSHPASNSSDAVSALRIEDGTLAWRFQGTVGDAWNLACGFETPANCPDPMGPDVDFGMAPILVKIEGGREILLVGQKSGVVYGLDPDQDGARMWQTKIGKGSALGGVHWGMASDGKLAYATNSDSPSGMMGIEPEFPASPGVFALDMQKGEVRWRTPPPGGACDNREGCVVANSAAPTAIPGVVFAGALDGHLRAYSSSDGRIIWDFDTLRDYQTVNGVKARGGAIDGPGPVIVDGMVYSHSGYGWFGQIPGNVLLAFGVPETAPLEAGAHRDSAGESLE